MTPYRADLVVAVACLSTWSWLADLCAREDMPFVLGHALSMQAIHGGQAKNAKIEAPKIAVLFRGGMIPQASVSPAEMRSTRDLLRRRMHLIRKRAALLGHVQKPTGSTTCQNSARNRLQANHPGSRSGFSIRGPEQHGTGPGADRPRRPSAQRPGTIIVNAAKEHEVQTFYRLQTVPGIGKS